MDALKQKQLRLKFILVTILAILVLNAWVLHRNFRSVSEQEQWVSHTASVISELDLILSSAKDAETGTRGYILTNKEEYLEPFRNSIVEAITHLNKVKELTKDNSIQQVELVTIEDTINKRFQILDEVIKTFRQKRGVIDRDALPMTEGKITMDMLRNQIEKMKRNEETLLKSRTEAAGRSKTIFNLVLVLTTFLSTLVIAIVFVQIYKNLIKAAELASFEAETAREKEIIGDSVRLIAGNVSLEDAGAKILEFLSKNFGVLAGRLFIQEQNELRIVASFAVKESKFKPGNPKEDSASNNLIQVAFSRNEPWEVNNVPENYWHVSSSLGESVPKTLLLLPYSFQGRTLGVLELAFFDNLTPDNKRLISLLADSIGIGLNAAQSRGHLQALLERTQQQSEELQAQQEELRTNNEELEQQARALESQQQALNIKNRELEVARYELEGKAEDLEKSSQYKSDFLAKMSHELRTPLNGLLILSTLLIENKEKTLTKQQTQFAQSIHNAGNDLLMLINDILDLSKIEARKLILRKEDFTLESLLASKKLTFGPQTTAKGLDLIVELPEELKQLHLKTDRQRLEQILRNFLSNAIKFTEKGHVKIIAAFDELKASVSLTVEDTGIGIAADKQSTVFEAFEQADSSVSRKFGGTGLGLTISRELAALLGGEITLESVEGIGSKFKVTIPLELKGTGTERVVVPLAKNETHKESRHEVSEKAEPQTKAENARSTERINLMVRASLKNINPKAKTILIVEDDPAFRASVVEAVKAYGFEAIEASDGEVALAILNEVTPSAILLDIKLPGISGLGILEMIKHMPHLRHIPVHMVSALEYQQSALRMGALGYLTKPVTIEKVRSALGRIENLISKQLKRVLLIEDDERQSMAVSELIAGDDIEVCPAKTGKDAVRLLGEKGFDCIILDLTLPDVSGFDFLSELSSMSISVPPIVIYTGKDLSDEEEAYLRRFSESIIIKGARSPERLLDEVNLFLHRVESMLPLEKREMLSNLRSQEKSFEGKTVLIVDDDIRNVFAMTSALEARGLEVLVARDGVEALAIINKEDSIDLILMDIMMPRMDGYEATRKIRESNIQRVRDLPVIALTAKAMREDHEKCMEAGASDYLPKPVNLDNLTTVLKVWLAPKGFIE